MSTTLHLTLKEYRYMVARGAFDAINRKVELIRGEIVEMNPAGPVHNDLVAYLHDWSVRSTERSTLHIRGQSGIDIPQLESCPEPDVFWVKARRYLDAHPTGSDTLLAIEVADSSLKADRTSKADLYAEAGIQEYWVVDVQGKCIYVMREVAADRHYGWQRTAKIGETVSPLAQPSAILNIAELFGVS
jgi:Uma2 family endonuclease